MARNPSTRTIKIRARQRKPLPIPAFMDFTVTVDRPLKVKRVVGRREPFARTSSPNAGHFVTPEEVMATLRHKARAAVKHVFA